MWYIYDLRILDDFKYDVYTTQEGSQGNPAGAWNICSLRWAQTFAIRSMTMATGFDIVSCSTLPQSIIPPSITPTDMTHCVMSSAFVTTGLTTGWSFEVGVAWTAVSQGWNPEAQSKDLWFELPFCHSEVWQFHLVYVASHHSTV